MKHETYSSHREESYAKEGIEFEDPEFFQMTISKVSKELGQVKKECQYWKDAARNQVHFLLFLGESVNALIFWLYINSSNTYLCFR